MAKKKKSAKKQAASTGGGTRCQQGGPEILPGLIRLAPADTVSLRLTLCKSGFRVAVFLDTTLLLDQVANDEVSLMLPPLVPGRSVLSWFYLPTASTWQIKSEVEVGSSVRFRKRKADDSDKPDRTGFVFLEVVS